MSETGPRVVELPDVAEHHAAAALLRRIWRADQLLDAALIRAFAHSGNYVAGAFRGSTLVGVAIGFLGAGHLHSHIVGVDPADRGGGTGYALKQHQRDWALDRGITEVCWTFDPLVRRNAYFNLHKLGAFPTEYLPEFYGQMDDGINAGDVSDRLYVTWRLASPAAIAAAHGSLSTVDVAALRADGAAIVVDRDGAGGVATGPVPADGRTLLVAVPTDIEELRPRDPALATRWRYAVRGALVAGLASGYRITGMAREGYYVLEAA